MGSAATFSFSWSTLEPPSTAITCPDTNRAGGAAEEQDHVGDVGAVADHADGVVGAATFAARHRLGEPPHALGVVDVARRDAVDPDAVRAPTPPPHVRVNESTPAFAAATWACIAAPFISNGAVMFTMLPPCSPQPGVERRLRHVVGAEQVDVDDGLEPVGRDRRHRRGEVAGGVVDDDVESAVVRDDAVDHALHGAGVADVARVERAPRSPRRRAPPVAASRTSCLRLAMAMRAPW